MEPNYAQPHKLTSSSEHAVHAAAPVNSQQQQPNQAGMKGGGVFNFIKIKFICFHIGQFFVCGTVCSDLLSDTIQIYDCFTQNFDAKMFHYFQICFTKFEFPKLLSGVDLGRGACPLYFLQR